MLRSPSKPLRKLAQEEDIGLATAHKAAQEKLQLFPYKVTALNELKTAITAPIRNITQADLQKVFVNKIRRIQACINARGHHFQHILKVHSDFPNADLQKVLVYKIKRVQACIDARGHHFKHLL
jgi:hypothetical protein